MASPLSNASLPSIALLFFLLLSSSPMIGNSQDLGSSNPTIANCMPNLLPLTPCAPFAQGMAQSPVQSCCDNLLQLYTQQPHCLCLLLNDTSLSAFPINRTLALQLPLLCNLQGNASDCLGLAAPPASPHPQASRGTNTNPIINTPSAFMWAPKPSMSGNDSGSGVELKPYGMWAASMVTVALILMSAA